MCLSVLWRRFSKNYGSVSHDQAKAPHADLEADDRGRRPVVVQSQAPPSPAPEVSSTKPQGIPYTSSTKEYADAKALRDGLMVEASTSIITVFAVQDGSILFQNPRSRAYFGDRLQDSHAAAAMTGAAATAAAAAAPFASLSAVLASVAAVAVMAPPISVDGGEAHHCPENTAGAHDAGPGAAALAGSALAQLFALEPQKLIWLLEAVASAAGEDGSGRVWKGVIRVPPQLAVPDLVASPLEEAREEEEVDEEEEGEAAAVEAVVASPASVPALANGWAGNGGLLVAQDGGAGPGPWAQGRCVGQPPAPAGRRRLKSPLRSFHNRRLAQQQWGHSLPHGGRPSVSHQPIETLAEGVQLCDDATSSSRYESMTMMVVDAPPSGAATTATGSASGLCRPASYVTCRPQSYDLATAPYGPVKCRSHSGVLSLRAFRSHTGGREISAAGSVAVRNLGATAAAETPRLIPVAADAATMGFPPLWQRSPFYSTDTSGAAALSQSMYGSATPFDAAAAAAAAAAVTAEHLEEALTAGSGPLATSVLTVALSENPSLARTLSIGHMYNPYSSTQYGRFPYLRSPAGSGTGLQRLSATVVAEIMGSSAATTGAEMATAGCLATAAAAAPASHPDSAAHGDDDGLLRPPGPLPPPPPLPLSQQQPQDQQQNQRQQQQQEEQQQQLYQHPQQVQVQGELDNDGDESFARQLPRVAAPAARLLGRREGSCSWPRYPVGCGSDVSGVCTSPSLAGSDGITRVAGFGCGPSRLGSGPAGLGSRLPGLGSGPAGFVPRHAGLGSGPAGLGSGPAGLGSGPAGLGSGPAGLGSRLAGPGSGPAGLGSGPAGFVTEHAGPGSGPAGLGSGPAGFGSRLAGPGSGPAGLGSGPTGLGSGPAGLGSGPDCLGSGPDCLGSGPAGLGSGPAGLGYVLAAGAAAPAGDACCSGQLMTERLQPSNDPQPHTPTLHQRCSRLASGSHATLGPQGGSRATWCSQASSNGGRTAACSFLDERAAGTFGGDMTPSWLLSAAASDYASTAPLSAHMLPYMCRSTSTELMMAAACGGAGSLGGPAVPPGSKMVTAAAAAAVVTAALSSRALQTLGLEGEAMAAEPNRGHQTGLALWQLGSAVPPSPGTSVPPSSALPAAGTPPLVVQLNESAVRQAAGQARDEAQVFAWPLPPLGVAADVALAARMAATRAGAADAGARPAPPQPDGSEEAVDSCILGGRRQERTGQMTPPGMAAAAVAVGVRELRIKDGSDAAAAPHSSDAVAFKAAAAGRGLLCDGADGDPGACPSPTGITATGAGRPVDATAQACESPGRSNEALQKIPTDVSDETEWGMVATFRQSALVCAARSQGQATGLGSGSGGGGGGSSDLEGRDSPDAVSLHVALKASAAQSAGAATVAAAAAATTGAATPAVAVMEAGATTAAAAADMGAKAARTATAAAIAAAGVPLPEEVKEQQQEQRRVQGGPSEGQRPAPQQRPGSTARELSRWAARAPVVPRPLRPPPLRPPATAPCLPARGTEAGLESSPPSGLLDRSRSLQPVQGCCWHRVFAAPAVDPVTGRSVIVVMQDDVTGKVQLERRLGLMQETEHRLLEQLYPHHMLAHLADEVVTQQRLEQQQLQQLQQLMQLRRRQQSSTGQAAGDAEAGVGAGRVASQGAAAAAAGAGAGAAGPTVAAAACSRQASLERSNGQLQRVPLCRYSNAGAGLTNSSCSLSLASLRPSAPLHDHSYTMATMHPQVTLLFADIKGFTPLCNKIQPREIMAMLNALFCRFDALLDKYHVRKVETIGDAYFVAGGLAFNGAIDSDGAHCDAGAAGSDRTRSVNAEAAVPCGAPAATAVDAAAEDASSTAHALNVIGFAKAMLAAARHVATPTTGEPVEIRVGIHSGPVVSGLLGSRMPRFCLFGAAVAVAARMEATGEAGAVQISETTYRLLPLKDRVGWEATPGVEVKGVGRMQTYVWRGAAAFDDGRRPSGGARQQ